VVGAGPAGSVAAKKCAESGMKCLLLDKAEPPRNKVCSGMLMGRQAQDIVRAEFGEVPKEALTDPYKLTGYKIHYPGADRQEVFWPTPIGWRKDLDWWMNRRAVERGAAFWIGTRVLGLSEAGGRYTVSLERKGKTAEVTAKYVVGADGATSAVRRSLFPDLTVRYVQNYRECYLGAKVDLEPGYFHAVFPPGGGLVYQAAHHKDGYLILEMGAGPGKVKEIAERFKAYLSRDFGLDPGLRPAQRDGCLAPALLRELASRKFQPAMGNVMLAGDAAGLLMPLTGEGIGWALKSGVLAAGAIAEAEKRSCEAGRLYLKNFVDIIETLDIILTKARRIAGEIDKGPRHIAGALKECWETSLEIA